MKTKTGNASYAFIKLTSFIMLFAVLISCNSNTTTSSANADTASVATTSTAANIKPAQPPPNFKSQIANGRNTPIARVVVTLKSFEWNYFR